MAEILVRPHHLVQPAAEELDMLGLFPEKRSEENLLLSSYLCGAHRDQWQEVARDALLPRLEQGHRAEDEVFFDLGEAGPVSAVACEVDRLRVPRPQTLGLLEEPHGHRLPLEAALRDGRVPCGVLLGCLHSRSRPRVNCKPPWACAGGGRPRSVERGSSSMTLDRGWRRWAPEATAGTRRST